MDPFTGAVVVGLLVQYAKHLAGVASEVVDDGVKKGLAAVWGLVADRFHREPGAAAALDRMAAEPDNARRQAAVEDYLDDALRADAEFDALLRRAVAALPASSITVNARDSGAVVAGGSLTISGGQIAAGRDVVTGDPRDTRPARG